MMTHLDSNRRKTLQRFVLYYIISWVAVVIPMFGVLDVVGASVLWSMMPYMMLLSTVFALWAVAVACMIAYVDHHWGTPDHEDHYQL